MTAAWCEQCNDVIVFNRREWIHADSLQPECDPDRIHAANLLGAGDCADVGTVPTGHPILDATP
jgi:hypothetical protein